jgi:hypothetical protein
MCDLRTPLEDLVSARRHFSLSTGYGLPSLIIPLPQHAIQACRIEIVGMLNSKLKDTSRSPATRPRYRLETMGADSRPPGIRNEIRAGRRLPQVFLAADSCRHATHWRWLEYFVGQDGAP